MRIERDAAPPEALKPAAREISALNWNIGYAGLGADSDFLADGGRMLRPPSRRAVERNLAGVLEALRARDCDIQLLQETAKAGFLTRGVDVVGALRGALAGRDNAYSEDISGLSRGPLALSHGLFSSTRLAGAERDFPPLPLEPGRIAGLYKRRYHVQSLSAPIAGGGRWTVFNVHLAAFDDGAKVRRAQLRAALDLAEARFAAGDHVVIGGDFNLAFAPIDRPSTTQARHLDWLHPFPHDMLKPDWRTAFDARTPSVRTNERPYRRGENFTAAIDGFIVSPNVETAAVAVIDLDFAHSDHQPVFARLRAR